MGFLWFFIKKPFCGPKKKDIKEKQIDDTSPEATHIYSLFHDFAEGKDQIEWLFHP